MGLLFKPCPAHAGSKDTTSQVLGRVWSQQEVIENVCCEDSSVQKEDVIDSTSRRYLTEDEQFGRLAGPDLPLRDDPLPRDDPSFLAYCHPLLGPFQNFPGTQFWEDYWHRKEMIKWYHREVLTKNMSLQNFQRCFRDIINHHSNLLQSIKNQQHDGIAEGPLLHLIVDDHAQLLTTSELVLVYFHIIRIPAILGGLYRIYANSSESASWGSRQSSAFHLKFLMLHKFVLSRADPEIGLMNDIGRDTCRRT